MSPDYVNQKELKELREMLDEKDSPLVNIIWRGFVTLLCTAVIGWSGYNIHNREHNKVNTDARDVAIYTKIDGFLEKTRFYRFQRDSEVLNVEHVSPFRQEFLYDRDGDWKTIEGICERERIFFWKGEWKCTERGDKGTEKRYSDADKDLLKQGERFWPLIENSYATGE